MYQIMKLTALHILLIPLSIYSGGSFIQKQEILHRDFLERARLCNPFYSKNAHQLLAEIQQPLSAFHNKIAELMKENTHHQLRQITAVCRKMDITLSGKSYDASIAFWIMVSPDVWNFLRTRHKQLIELEDFYNGKMMHPTLSFLHSKRSSN